MFAILLQVTSLVTIIEDFTVSSPRAVFSLGRTLLYEKRERNHCERPSLIEPAGKT